jgi:hypothetical protein
MMTQQKMMSWFVLPHRATPTSTPNAVSAKRPLMNVSKRALSAGSANFQDFIMSAIDCVRHLDHDRIATDLDNASNDAAIVPRSQDYVAFGRNGDRIADIESSHLSSSLCARYASPVMHIHCSNTTPAGITRTSGICSDQRFLFVWNVKHLDLAFRPCGLNTYQNQWVSPRYPLANRSPLNDIWAYRPAPRGRNPIPGAEQMQMTNHPNRTIDSRVRRVARSVGLQVCKARGGMHCNNWGGYMLINERNECVHGSCYELSAEDVLFWCQPENREKLGHWWPEDRKAAG